MVASSILKSVLKDKLYGILLVAEVLRKTVDWLAKQPFPTSFSFIVFHYRNQGRGNTFASSLWLRSAIYTFKEHELSGKVYKPIGTDFSSSCFEYGRVTRSHLETEWKAEEISETQALIVLICWYQQWANLKQITALFVCFF